jgi:hypothetical protein
MCPFRKFHPVGIRAVRQNHRIIRVDAFEGVKLSHGETVSGKATGRPTLPAIDTLLQVGPATRPRTDPAGFLRMCQYKAHANRNRRGRRASKK